MKTNEIKNKYFDKKSHLYIS